MIKQVLIILNALLLVALVSNAQNNGNVVTSDNWDQNMINEFIVHAAQGSMMEVQLGEMAKKQTSSPQVKDFGEMMVDDHSTSHEKLKRIAEDMKVMVPESLDQKHQEEIDKLSDKTGEDFDEEYIEMMIEDHKEDITKFEKARENVPEGELKTWIDETLPVLQKHLDQAQAVEDQVTATSR